MSRSRSRLALLAAPDLGKRAVLDGTGSATLHARRCKLCFFVLKDTGTAEQNRIEMSGALTEQNLENEQTVIINVKFDFK